VAWLRVAALPTVVWGLLPDDQRVPADEPFAWLKDGQLAELGARLDRLVDEDQHMADRFMAAEADRRAAEAHQRQMDEIRADALEAARQEAQRVAGQSSPRPPERSSPTVEEMIGAEVAKAVRPAVIRALGDRQRANRRTEKEARRRAANRAGR
jgi:hypothetical protein